MSLVGEFNLQAITKNFVEELRTANSGKKTSLPYIVHQFSGGPIVKDGEVFQVLVFGGSIFLNVLLEKRGRRIIIKSRERKSKEPYDTKESFLKTFAEELDPNVRVVAVNFAFPLSPVFEDGKLDGMLMSGSKEHTFHGLLGKRVGKIAQDYILKTQKRTISVSVANDTVCLLLSGLTEVATHNIAAGVLGTGMNFAFFLNDNTLVNLEAANFDKFPQTETGKIIDQHSVIPGKALLEKETSGAYLYQHFNIINEQEKLGAVPLASTLELDQLIREGSLGVGEVAKMLIERSAELISCAIAGITLFKEKDMVFVMEGSMFWNATGYRRIVKRKLLELAPDYDIRFIKIEDSPVFGAAKLVA